MRVGLGTGTTVHHTIMALAERSLDLRCVSTSERTRQLAVSLGLTVVLPDSVGRLDIVIDGADEVDSDCNLVKGGGGALTREKVVAQMTTRFVVVVDETKVVRSLGAFGVPVEVLDFAPGVVGQRLRDLGAIAVDTMSDRSDNGNLLMRASFGSIDEPASLACSIAELPGVVEHGIFLAPTVERVIVGALDGQVRQLFPPGR